MLDPDIRRLLDTVFNVAPVQAHRTSRNCARRRNRHPRCSVGNRWRWIRSSTRTSRAMPPRSRLRVYRPRRAPPLPLVLYAHGGGWVTGSLESHDRLCRILASRLQARSSSRSTIAVHRNTSFLPRSTMSRWHGIGRAPTPGTLGADGARFAVAGDSSGGNLAAALTLRLRASRSTPAATAAAALSRRSTRPARAIPIGNLRRGFNLSAERKWRGTGMCIGPALPANVPELSPLAAANLSGLAPAVIAIAENDVLRDDGLDYAQRLEAAGVTSI